MSVRCRKWEAVGQKGAGTQEGAGSGTRGSVHLLKTRTGDIELTEKELGKVSGGKGSAQKNQDIIISS